jgi:predicted esterase
MPSRFLLLAVAACGDGGGGSGESAGEGKLPFKADDCITDVSVGDHVFECNGLTFLTKVDERCTREPCGLIFDVHGFSMSGQQMRDNTLLHELAPKAGYITVHPSAPGAAPPGEDPTIPGGSWAAKDYPQVFDFMERVIAAYQVDPKRVHVTGFSQGGMMTWWFLCEHSDLLASAAPVAAAMQASAACVDDDWSPRIPILYMNGETDTASTIKESRALVTRVTEDLELKPEGEIEGDAEWKRERWDGKAGMRFDYIEHKYGGQAVLAGHCLPGGVDTPGGPNNYSANATTCTEGDIKLNWGETVLKFFQEHPKP